MSSQIDCKVLSFKCKKFVSKIDKRTNLPRNLDFFLVFVMKIFSKLIAVAEFCDLNFRLSSFGRDFFAGLSPIYKADTGVQTPRKDRKRCAQVTGRLSFFCSTCAPCCSMAGVRGWDNSHSQGPKQKQNTLPSEQDHASILIEIMKPKKNAWT